VNRKRVPRVMRERALLVRLRRLRARRKKEWRRVEATQPNQIWQSEMTKIWAGSWLSVSGQRDRLLQPGNRGLESFTRPSLKRLVLIPYMGCTTCAYTFPDILEETRQGHQNS